MIGRRRRPRYSLDLLRTFNTAARHLNFTRAARELFLTGTRFSARRAREIGLVHEIVSPSDLDATVRKYVDECLTGGREAIAAAKALIAQVWNQPFEAAVPMTAAALAQRRVSAEGQEGLRAFLEKRKPSWNHS